MSVYVEKRKGLILGIRCHVRHGGCRDELFEKVDLIVCPIRARHCLKWKVHMPVIPEIWRDLNTNHSQRIR